MIAPDPNRHVAREEFAWCLQHAKAPQLRTIREFAEDEIVLPDGPYEGRRFRADRQPWHGLYLDAIDEGLAKKLWRRFALVAPTQSGKTLVGVVIPTLYHLFEVGESVVFGVPDMDLAADKWNVDLKPAVERTRYAHLLPATGAGSRGGSKLKAITFQNGVTLRFMSKGGSDQARSAFTARVLVITEVDGLDTSSETSREADAVSQLEGRTNAFDDDALVYLECTASIEEGRIWQELLTGTGSRICLPCPKCRKLVTPDREHLVGWQTAATEQAARQASKLSCPACEKTWTEKQRVAANQRARVVHGKQKVSPKGRVSGQPPETETFSFRATAVNNLFTTMGKVGLREWLGRRDPNPDNADKKLRQQTWALPAEPPTQDVEHLSRQAITSRQGPYAGGIVPRDAAAFVVAIDVGKYLGHWLALAEASAGYVVGYGRFEIPADSFVAEKAVEVALRDQVDQLDVPWPTDAGGRLAPDQVWIDSGWYPEAVYRFCAKDPQRYRPLKGFGETQYRPPQKLTKTVRWIGRGTHIARVKWEEGVAFLVELNSDAWKSDVHNRLATPAGDGSLQLYQADPTSHGTLARHLTSEKAVGGFVPGSGYVVRWVRVHKNNHWLDAAAYACAAAAYAKRRRRKQPNQPKAAPAPMLTMPDGRPFFIGAR